MNNLFLTFAIVALFNVSQTIAQNAETTDYTNAEKFGEEVFKSIKSENYSLMVKFLPTTQDIDELKNTVLKANPNMTETEKQKMEREVAELQKRRIKEAKEEYTKIRNLGIEKGIEWKMVSLKTIEYELKKKGGITRGNVYLIFEFLGAEYIIDLDDCLKVSRTWLIGDDIRFKGEY